MGESNLFGVSFRCIIAFAVITTVCYMALRGVDVKEPMHSISLLVVGAYFGKISNVPNGNGEKKKEEQKVNV